MISALKWGAFGSNVIAGILIHLCQLKFKFLFIRQIYFWYLVHARHCACCLGIWWWKSKSDSRERFRVALWYVLPRPQVGCAIPWRVAHLVTHFHATFFIGSPWGTKCQRASALTPEPTLLRRGQKWGMGETKLVLACVPISQMKKQIK